MESNENKTDIKKWKNIIKRDANKRIFWTVAVHFHSIETADNMTLDELYESFAAIQLLNGGK